MKGEARRYLLWLMTAAAVIVGGCSRQGGEKVRIDGPADLKGRHVAHMSSDFHKQELVKLQPDIVFDPYSEFSFAIESLRNGKIDAISMGKTYADIWMAKFPGEFRVAFDYAEDVIANRAVVLCVERTGFRSRG